MLKRKFQDCDQWSTQKTSSWLKSYPKFMLELNAIRTIFIKNKTACNTLFMLYQRSKWISINASLVLAKNPKVEIANVYVAEHAKKELTSMKKELLDLETSIHQCYISLVSLKNKSHFDCKQSLQLGTIDVKLRNYKSALAEMYFYFQKINFILKNWETDINNAFHVQFCKKLPLFGMQFEQEKQLKKEYKQIHNQEEFANLKIELGYDFYKAFPKELLLADELPLSKFCEYLSMKTMQSKIYWNELYVNTNLVLTFFFKIDGKFQLASYNSEKQIITCMQYGNVVEFRLLKPFSIYNALTQENCLSYNFESKSKDVLCIQKCIDLYCLNVFIPIIDLVKIVSSYIVDEYIHFYQAHEVQTQFFFS